MTTWPSTGNTANPAPYAAKKSSGYATPITKPTTAPAAKPAAKYSPIADSPASSVQIGPALWTSSKISSLETPVPALSQTRYRARDEVMLAFIDESGDAGMKLTAGSSPFFCIVAAVSKDQFSADACDRAIEDLPRRTHQNSRYEFHFSHCPDPTRLDFLRCVSFGQFSYHAFVIDKSKLRTSLARTRAI